MDNERKLIKISDLVCNLTVPAERLEVLLGDMENDYFDKDNINPDNEDDKIKVFARYRDNRIKCNMANAEMIKIQELICKIEDILRGAI